MCVGRPPEVAPYGLDPWSVNTVYMVCLASWGADNRSTIHPSIHHPFSEIPRTFSSFQPPSLCPDRWWEEGGGSVINNANLVLAQKHYCEGNEKEKIMDKIPNRQEWKSLDYSLCRWSCSHRQTKNRISFCLRGATWWRWRLFLCVIVCVPELPVVPGSWQQEY